MKGARQDSLIIMNKTQIDAIYYIRHKPGVMTTIILQQLSRGRWWKNQKRSFVQKYDAESDRRG